MTGTLDRIDCEQRARRLCDLRDEVRRLMVIYPYDQNADIYFHLSDAANAVDIAMLEAAKAVLEAIKLEAA